MLGRINPTLKGFNLTLQADVRPLGVALCRMDG